MIKLTSARFVLEVDLYQRDVYVSLGETDERFRQGLLRYKDAAFVEEALKHMAVPAQSGSGRMGMNNGFYIIRLGVYPRSSQDYAVLQHELFHFVETMLTSAGLLHTLEHTSEAYAYLIQYLTAQLYERLWRVED